MTEKLKPFYADEYIYDDEGFSMLLEDALESGHAGYMAGALGTIARARGMTQIAKEAGVTREALYKALSAEGDPRLSTLLGVIKALNLKLSISQEDKVAPRGKSIAKSEIAAE
jgi:probable addiction module antidote protein